MVGLLNWNVCNFMCSLSFIIFQARIDRGSIEMPFKVSYEEDGFLRQLGVLPEEGEPLAKNCSQILGFSQFCQSV